MRDEQLELGPAVRESAFRRAVVGDRLLGAHAVDDDAALRHADRDERLANGFGARACEVGVERVEIGRGLARRGRFRERLGLRVVGVADKK